MKKIDDIIVYGDPIDEGAMAQMRTTMRTAYRGALMADHHKGYSMPIGGVIAYQNAISPSGVGYDIGCGNKAVKLDVQAVDVPVYNIVDRAWEELSFGVGMRNETRVDHALFDSTLWQESEFLRADGQKMYDLARNQLGTIGSGNHYVDIFKDEDGYVWIGVHFGSRGFGHKTATHFLKAAGAKDGFDEPACVLGLDTDLGDQYYQHMKLAGEYAYAGRDWVCQTMADFVGAPIIDEVHNHHNFAWKETHFGEELVVVRKGATPAFPGQRGFVGASMGEDSVILEGVASFESNNIMCSTVHGAGRVMSRTQAAGKLNYKTRVRAGGEVSYEMRDEWVDRKGVYLKGSGTDESPHCYKRLNEVLAHHASTVNVLHRLQPLGVMMAPETTVDPFKD